MGRSEIMSILICFHFNTFRNFKHYYLFYVKNHLHDLFPNQLSYNRFIELELLLKKVLPDSSLCQNGKQVEIITKERQLSHSP